MTAGTPSPTVFWKIVDTNEVIYGKLLNINITSRNQRGEYKCFANNTCGSDSSTIIIYHSLFVLTRLSDVCCSMFFSLIHVFI